MFQTTVSLCKEFYIIILLFSFLFFSLSFFFFFFWFLELYPQCMEAPRLGVDLELQAYTIATAMPDLSHVCHLHRSSWQ